MILDIKPHVNYVNGMLYHIKESFGSRERVFVVKG